MKSDSIEVKISRVLKKRKKTLALAESCTGGLVSSRITDVPGSSEYFRGGIIAYSNDVKVSVLNVAPDIIKKYGAVSRESALEMALGVKRLLNTDIAVSATGIAGPGGGTKGKPAGLAYIAFVSDKTKNLRKVFFKGSRATLKKRFSDSVLKLILKNLSSDFNQVKT